MRSDRRSWESIACSGAVVGVVFVVPRPIEQLTVALTATNPAGTEAVVPMPPPPGRPAPWTRRPRAWLIGGGLALLVAAAAVSAATVDSDSGVNLLGLARSVSSAITNLRWQYTAIVIGLAATHYLATAIAARAAAGVPLALRETFLVQLAAAAANRLTPAGLGGSAITARYFTRRGLSTPAAIGAVGALAVLGAVADLLVLCGLVFVGGWLGLHGAAGEIAALTNHVVHLLGPVRSPWLWLVLALLAVGLLGARAARRRPAQPGQCRRVWEPIRRLAHQPGALATLVVASGTTTLVLAFAFVATTAMVPGPQPTAGLGALLIAFMLGAAAGSAVPIPAGLGSTEAALIAVLISVHIPAQHAVEEVLIFRLLTFWAPAAVGILATRALYRSRAL